LDLLGDRLMEDVPLALVCPGQQIVPVERGDQDPFAATPPRTS
jgi:hypothetical protein